MPTKPHAPHELELELDDAHDRRARARRAASPLDAPPIDASTDPTSQLRIALDRGLAELALAKKHGVPGAIVALDVLEQLTRSAARELARGVRDEGRR